MEQLKLEYTIAWNSYRRLGQISTLLAEEGFELEVSHIHDVCPNYGAKHCEGNELPPPPQLLCVELGSLSACLPDQV